MHRNPKILIPIFIVLVVAATATAFYILQTSSQANETTVSGTIEATDVHLGTQMGGLVSQVYVNEGDDVQAGQVVAEVQPASGVSAGYTEKIRTPINGVVLERDLEPGEIALPASTLITVGDLTRLTLTVYVPEDRYGQITLGQEYPVAVDSFPGRAFSGKVTYISDQAEFTPRNVQTVQGRKATVYAVRLSLDNPDLALKPGMPADVNLEIK